jgi:uncharacterized protein (TIGR02246 family)
MIRTGLALGFCAAGMIALARPAPTFPSESTRMVPPGTDTRLLSAVRKANADFEIAMTKGDTASIAAPYTSDAVFVGPDGTATKGRAQIEQLYRDRFAKSGPAVESRIESEEIMLGGDLAYERGSGVFTHRENAKPVIGRARFLTIWQRQPDGDWKILRNVVLPAQ